MPDQEQLALFDRCDAARGFGEDGDFIGPQRASDDVSFGARPRL